MLSAVLTSAPIEPDKRMERALCHGPKCGRCLSSCPGDVIGQWERDWPACDKYRNPHGFKQLTDFLGEVIDTKDTQIQKEMIRSEDSFNLWQSILRGAGAVTGCRRCQDVCPVGQDYESLLKDVLDLIPEDSAEKQSSLARMLEGLPLVIMKTNLVGLGNLMKTNSHSLGVHIFLICLINNCQLSQLGMVRIQSTAY